MQKFQETWNETESLVSGLAGFEASIEYGWEDPGRVSGFLRIENGRATAVFGGIQNPTFIMRATPENWRLIHSGALNGRAALLTRRVRFTGSMITAMRYMAPFNESFKVLASVPGTID